MKKSQLDEKSRTQLKREYRALKQLAIGLAGLSKGQLDAMPLSEKTRAAALAAQGMPRNALHRHYRYLSALIAEQDVAAIRSALNLKRFTDPQD